MQSWFTTWLALPVPALFVSLFAFYLFTAALMVWLSFRSRLSRRIQSFKGVVAPFFGSTATHYSMPILRPLIRAHSMGGCDRQAIDF